VDANMYDFPVALPKACLPARPPYTLHTHPRHPSQGSPVDDQQPTSPSRQRPGSRINPSNALAPFLKGIA